MDNTPMDKATEQDDVAKVQAYMLRVDERTKAGLHTFNWTHVAQTKAGIVGSGTYRCVHCRLTPEEIETHAREQAAREARIDELTRFKPLQASHDNCLQPLTCIGYQNAVSDFDNEKELRLIELQAPNPTQENQE